MSLFLALSLALSLSLALFRLCLAAHWCVLTLPSSPYLYSSRFTLVSLTDTIPCSPVVVTTNKQLSQ